MPTSKTQEEWMNAIKSGGLFVLRGNEYYFIPVDVMTEWKMPPEFQKKQVGIPDTYFQKVNQAPAGAEPFNVHDRINDAAGSFSMRDGFDVAAWLVPTTAAKKNSAAEDSRTVLFEFNPTLDKIVIDMSKGSKPSKNP